MRIILSILLLSVCYPITFSKIIQLEDGTSSTRPRSIVLSDDREYVLTGSLHYERNNNEFLFIAKTDSIGNLKWNKVIENQNHHSIGASSIDNTSDGGYVTSQMLWYKKVSSNK